MSGLQPPILPPQIPTPSHSVLTEEELYKCANPPPSYSVAIGALDATPVQGRHQLQAREVILGPFGGSLCRVVPMTSAELPPAYSRRSPSNGDSCGFLFFDFLKIVQKQRLWTVSSCVARELTRTNSVWL